MMSRRQTLIWAGLFFLASFGGMQLIWLYDHCSKRCETLWAINGLVILATIALIESLIAQRRPLDLKQYQERYKYIADYLPRGNRLVWISAILRVILSSMILSLPLFFQGAFVILVTAPPIGVGLVALVRGIAGWLPPLPEHNITKKHGD